MKEPAGLQLLLRLFLSHSGPSRGFSLALKSLILPVLSLPGRAGRRTWGPERLSGPQFWPSLPPASQELGEQKSGPRMELTVSTNGKVKQWVGSVFS